MATNVGTAYVTIMPSMNGFSSKLTSGIESAFSSASSTSDKAGSKSGSGFSTGFAAKLGGIAGLASSAFTAVGNVVSSSMSSAISRVDTLNQFPKVMQSLGFSAEDASATMSKLSDGIEGLPTSLDTITASTQKIALLTGNLDLASDTALALNNAFLASGSSSEDASRGLLQYTQMLAKGKVDSQSWNTILETMGSSLKTVASRLGYTSTAVGGDLYTALQDGIISFDDFNQAIIECNSAAGGFASTASSASAGIGTSMANFRTAIVKNLANVINAINGAGAISGFFDGLKAAVNKAGSAIVPVAEKIGEAIPKISEAFKKLSKSDVEGFFGELKELTNIDFSGMISSVQSFANGFVANMKRAQNPTQALSIAVTQLATGFKALTGIDLPGMANSVQGFVNSAPGLSALATFVMANVSNFKSLASALITAKSPLDAYLAGVEYLKSSFSALSTYTTSVKSILSGVFDGLPEPVQNVINKVNEAKNKIVELASSAVGQGTIISGIAAVIATAFGGNILSAISAVKLAVSGIGIAFSGIGTAVNTALGGGGLLSLLTPIKTSLVGMVSPVGLVAAGVIALGAAFAYAMATDSSFASAIMNTVTAIGTSLAPIITTVGQAIQQIATSVLPVIMSMVQQLAPVLAQIVSVVLQVVAAVAPLVTQLVSILVPVITQIITTVTQLAQAVLPIVVTVLTTLMGIISAVLPVISNILSVVLNVISVVTTVITTIVSVVTAGITTVIGIISMVASVIGTVVTTVVTVFGTIAATITGVMSTISSVISGAVNGVISFFGSMVSSVGSGVNSLFSTISSIFNSISSTVINFANAAMNGAVSAFNALSSGVGSIISSLLSTVTSIPSQIMGVFSGAASWLYSAGGNIIQGLINGITGAIDGAISAVTSAVGSVIDGAKSALGIASPSKVFKQIGVFVDEGFAQGIQKMASAPANAMGNVVDSLIAAGQADMSGISAIDATISARKTAAAGASTNARNGQKSIVININGAVLNDDAAMQAAALNFMNELSRMNRLNKAGA